jgi:hypothetical protein
MLLGPGAADICTASLLADVGHEIPTALAPPLPTATLGARAVTLGLIEGIADGLTEAARLAWASWPMTLAAARWRGPSSSAPVEGGTAA